MHVAPAAEFNLIKGIVETGETEFGHPRKEYLAALGTPVRQELSPSIGRGQQVLLYRLGIHAFSRA